MVDLTLKWEKFGLARGLHEMMDCGELVDCTIMCQGHHLRAHKNVLAACSQQFREIFKENPGRDTIVVMKGVNLSHLKNMLQFMYLGEVTVAQDELPDFLTTADELGISALSTKARERAELLKPPPAPHETSSKPAVSSKRPRLEQKSSLNSDVKDSPGASSTTLQPEKSNKKQTPDITHPTVEMECTDLNSEIKVEAVDVSEDESNDPYEDGSMQDSSLGGPSEDISSGQFVALDEGEGPSGTQNSGAVQAAPWFELNMPYSGRELDSSEASATEVAKQSISQQSQPSTSQGFRRSFEEKDPLEISPPPLTPSFKILPIKKITLLSSGNSVLAKNVTKCSLCSVEFSSKSLKIHHEKTAHENLVKGQFTCGHCSQIFLHHGTLLSHIRSEHPTKGMKNQVRFPCELCSSSYGQKGDLVKHMRNEHGDLAVPHQCQICNKMFKNRKACYGHIAYMHPQYRKQGLKEPQI